MEYKTIRDEVLAALDQPLTAGAVAMNMAAERAVAKRMDDAILNQFGREIYTCNVDPSASLRKELDYERGAHRKTTELLIERDQQLTRAMEAVEVNRRSGNQEARERDQAVKVLELCIAIVRDLFAATNSAKEHAACKAALAAYEELAHAAEQREPASDPEAVGDPAIRHLSDCQGERAPGVAGGQLPGAPARTSNGTLLDDANQRLKHLFAGIKQRFGYTTLYVDFGDTNLHVRRVMFEAAPKVGTLAECLAFANDLADGIRNRQQAVLWRVPPSIDCQQDFDTGKVLWRFYCRYAAVSQEEYSQLLQIGNMR